MGPERDGVEEEYEVEKVTFCDTNILLPQSQWDFYERELNVYKEGKSETKNHLTNNVDIDESDLEITVADAEAVYGFLTGEGEEVCITEGVADQTIGMIRRIMDNIEERSSDYYFIQFNSLFPDGAKEKGGRIYSNLKDYLGVLGQLEKYVEVHPYERPKEEPYFIISNFIRALHDNFFDILKEDHNFDFNADEEISIAVLYETLANSRRVGVLSNDGDVQSLLGTVNVVLSKIKEDVKRNPIFKHYYANLPEVWTFWEPRENDPQPVDINGKGREIVKNLSGFDTSLRLSEEEKNQYFRKLGHFSKFLEKTVDSLIKSLNS